MLDSRHLRAFIILAETCHFGRSAEKLGIAQSALSAQLRRLEDVVGGRLLERGRRSSVHLTRPGRIFLEEAKRAVEDLERIERLGQLAVRGQAGPAHLGYVFSAAMTGVLARVLSEVRQTMPEIEIRASPMETPEQIAALSSGELELGLFRPRESYPPEIATQVVHREYFLLALGDRHPLAGRPALEAAELMTETFIVPRTGGRIGMESAVDELARQAGKPLPNMVSTGDFVTAISMAASGHGVVLCPRSLSRLNLPEVVYRPITDYNGKATLVLGWRVPSTEFVEALAPRLTYSEDE